MIPLAELVKAEFTLWLYITLPFTLIAGFIAWLIWRKRRDKE